MPQGASLNNHFEKKTKNIFLSEKMTLSFGEGEKMTNYEWYRATLTYLRRLQRRHLPKDPAQYVTIP